MILLIFKFCNSICWAIHFAVSNDGIIRKQAKTDLFGAMLNQMDNTWPEEITRHRLGNPSTGWSCLPGWCPVGLASLSRAIIL